MLTVRSLRSAWASSTKTAVQARHETRKGAETIHSGSWLLCPCWGSKDPWHHPDSSDTLLSVQPGPSQVTEGRRIFRAGSSLECDLGFLKFSLLYHFEERVLGPYWRTPYRTLSTARDCRVPHHHHCDLGRVVHVFKAEIRENSAHPLYQLNSDCTKRN